MVNITNNSKTTVVLISSNLVLNPMTDYLAGPGYVLERRRVTRLIQTFSFGQFRSNVLPFYTPRKLQMQLKREHISNKNLNAVWEAAKKKPHLARKMLRTTQLTATSASTVAANSRAKTAKRALKDH